MPSQAVHQYVSTVGDDADPNTVSPSDWNKDHAVTIPTGQGITDTGTTLGANDVLTVQGSLTVADPPLGFVGAFNLGTQTIRSDQYLLGWQQVTLTNNAILTVEPTGSVTIFDLPATNGQLTISGRS